MTWGSITGWSPPDGFAMHWFPGLDPAEATLLRVRFVAVDCGTEVCVHHSGWESRGASAAGKRDQYDGGWPVTLAAFGAFVALAAGAVAWAPHCSAALGAAPLLGDGLPTLAAERAIETSVETAATLDQAWEAWTTREGITSFFAPGTTTSPDSQPWAQAARV